MPQNTEFNLVQIPPAFLSKFQQLLGEDYNSFLECYTRSPDTGLRVNTLKCEPGHFIKMIQGNTIGWQASSIQPLSWCPSGFRIPENPEFHSIDLRLGKQPLHTAGIYYLQDPSAMAVAETLAPQPGERVLDLAAAPGGKTTHLAALMKNQGLIVANEIHPRRVWDLAQNIERCGVINTAILNETPQRLAKRFGPIFDRILVDAPCSGEGMFRKNQAAIQAWSPQLVESCATRQISLLKSAAQMVRPGGYLSYSTCTFSPEENEAVIARFLEDQSSEGYFYELIQIEDKPEFRPGEQAWLPQKHYENLPLDRAVRLWPHQHAAEGHFIALMRCMKNRDIPSSDLRSEKHPSKMLSSFTQFNSETLNVEFPEDRLITQGKYLYLIPENNLDLHGLKTIHPGWWLGEFRKNRFEPSHSLAMGLHLEQAQKLESLSLGTHAISMYFRGESLQVPGENGWTMITLDMPGYDQSFPIGWGKRSQGILKNYYPRGLRWYS